MIKKILQGTLVGIGSILPGVSGGMIAAAFNIYAKLIEALDLLTKKPIRAILSIWEYLLGIGLGILIGFIIVLFIFSFVPIPSTLLFIGLILGGVPDIYLLARESKIKVKSIIVILVTTIILVSVAFINPTSVARSNTMNYFIWTIVGILLAISLIIPGLSGTMILMMLGFYTPLLNLPKALLTNFVDGNYQTFFNQSINLVFIGLGVLLTFIIIGKLLNLILKHYPNTFYQFVLGIMLAAPINIIVSLHQELSSDEISPINIFNFSEHWYMWLIGLIILPLGIWVARQFNKKEAYETETN